MRLGWPKLHAELASAEAKLTRESTPLAKAGSLSRACYVAAPTITSTAAQAPPAWVELITMGMLRISAGGTKSLRWLEYHASGRAKEECHGHSEPQLGQNARVAILGTRITAA